jgi:hypothetical protein
MQANSVKITWVVAQYSHTIHIRWLYERDLAVNFGLE